MKTFIVSVIILLVVLNNNYRCEATSIETVTANTTNEISTDKIERVTVVKDVTIPSSLPKSTAESSFTATPSAESTDTPNFFDTIQPEVGLIDIRTQIKAVPYCANGMIYMFGACRCPED